MNTLLGKPYRAAADAIRYVLRDTDAQTLKKTYTDHAAMVAAYEIHRALYRVTSEIAARAATDAEFHQGTFYMAACGHANLPQDAGEVPEFARPYVEVEAIRRRRWELAFLALSILVGVSIALIIAFYPQHRY